MGWNGLKRSVRDELVEKYYDDFIKDGKEAGWTSFSLDGKKVSIFLPKMEEQSKMARGMFGYEPNLLYRCDYYTTFIDGELFDVGHGEVRRAMIRRVKEVADWPMTIDLCLINMVLEGEVLEGNKFSDRVSLLIAGREFDREYKVEP